MPPQRSRARIIGVVVALAAMIAAVIVYVAKRDDRPAKRAEPTWRGGAPSGLPRGSGAAAPQTPPPAAASTVPGQSRATIETVAGPGSVAGRVINWSTGGGVPGAELSFSGPTGVVTSRSADDGGFTLAAAPGAYRLATVVSPGFLPFAPEWDQSTVTVEVVPDRKVAGVTVFLFPAVDYTGLVVDKGGAPVARAHVRLLGNPSGEQVLEGLPTEWTTDAKGTFAFHAPDDSVFEAEHGGATGRAVLEGDVPITHKLVIELGSGSLATDQTIAGRVVDTAGAPVADVQVSAAPGVAPGAGGAAIAAMGGLPRVGAFATTGPEGTFVLRGLDRDLYDLIATLDGMAPARQAAVRGGARDVTITIDAGKPLAGTVRTTGGAVVGAFTLLVIERAGAARDVLIARSIVDAAGRFAVRVPDGSYDVVAAAPGWAPSRPTQASAGDTGVELVVSEGATITGTVASSKDGAPIQYARVNRETLGGGASIQPANAGTVTRDDGTFELTGIPPGPVSLQLAAGGFNPKIEAGLTAVDGQRIGPLAIALSPLDGAAPKLELVGVGLKLVPDGDALLVDGVIKGGSAEGAGIVAGDRVTAVDGAPTADLGLDGAIARIRGVEGTTVKIALARDPPVELTIVRRKLQMM